MYQYDRKPQSRMTTAAYFCPDEHKINPENTKYYRNPLDPNIAPYRANVFLSVESDGKNYIDLVRRNYPKADFVGHIFAPFPFMTVEVDYNYYDAHPMISNDQRVYDRHIMAKLSNPDPA